jgi:MoaA/NifB/PqqE/SkfB family radical SAM enzyme
LADIVAAGYRLCQPAVITIPTNGMLPDRVLTQVVAILEAAPDAQVGINLSLDGVGAQHDDIRGVSGAWDRAMATYRALRELEHPNLMLSIHTVVSRFNVADLPAIYEGLIALKPDSYITEVAEERVELGTVGAAITPSPDEYDRAAAFLIERLRRRPMRGFARVTRAFRMQYYGLAARILREQRQVIPCYAGWSSAHIAPEGDVWTCCTRAQPIGNLRETDFDFDAIWFGERARTLRRSIHAGECACPMANVSYTNMLLHPPTLARVAWRIGANA